MSERPPLDRALDALVYAPVGLALTVLEQLPRLAEEGRRRLAPQTRLARMVGEMAVHQGRRQVESILGRRAGDDPRAAGGPTAASGETSGTERGAATGTTPGEAAPTPGGPRAAAAEAATGRAVALTVVRADEPWPPAPGSAGEPPSADQLPIPGYDSLSASQVVQRLPGLSPDELDAVRTYEQAGRGRKTILNRVAQLRA